MRSARSWPRGLRLLLAGQVMSLLGDGVANVALIYAVLDATSSATDLGLVFAAQWLPLVAFLARRCPGRSVPEAPGHDRRGPGTNLYRSNTRLKD
jgi:hypothetical protein